MNTSQFSEMPGNIVDQNIKQPSTKALLENLTQSYEARHHFFVVASAIDDNSVCFTGFSLGVPGL